MGSAASPHSLDAMASVAYGPEAIVLVLAAAGGYGLGGRVCGPSDRVMDVRALQSEAGGPGRQAAGTVAAGAGPARGAAAGGNVRAQGGDTHEAQLLTEVVGSGDAGDVLVGTAEVVRAGHGEDPALIAGSPTEPSAPGAVGDPGCVGVE